MFNLSLNKQRLAAPQTYHASNSVANSHKYITTQMMGRVSRFVILLDSSDGDLCVVWPQSYLAGRVELELNSGK